MDQELGDKGLAPKTISNAHAVSLKDIEAVEAVEAGTYELRSAGILRWPSRADLAQKAATGEFNCSGQTSELYVQAVDEP